SRAASASGSFWFPGFLEFASSREFVGKPEKLYLSLGDAEARTRNPVMATVQDNTEKLAVLYRGRGLDTVFELNPGNHFKDPALRMAKGIRSILES
ncbi:MAG: alpha/beta hydrolase, partial [bacterium]|nr:alpha/beta hydrolase [bacterium]